jgi:8-oxo-dGTP pyrophosphatase MutT (NUDIX family)
MRRRQSARLLIISPRKRVLLFRFVHNDGPLAGDDYWATPGGGWSLMGETFEAAAIRELQEETGIRIEMVDAPVAEREAPLQLPDGEYVLAVERCFVIHVRGETLSRDEWTTHEVKVMAEYKWWSEDKLFRTADRVWPENILGMLKSAGCF